jgi:hypothetical protein
MLFKEIIAVYTENYTRPIHKKCTVGFEVLTAVSTRMAVFWVVAPWQTSAKLHGATTQKTAIFLGNAQLLIVKEGGWYILLPLGFKGLIKKRN